MAARYWRASPEVRRLLALVAAGTARHQLV
jgi:hypothetical protein